MKPKSITYINGIPFIIAKLRISAIPYYTPQQGVGKVCITKDGVINIPDSEEQALKMAQWANNMLACPVLTIEEEELYKGNLVFSKNDRFVERIAEINEADGQMVLLENRERYMSGGIIPAYQLERVIVDTMFLSKNVIDCIGNFSNNYIVPDMTVFILADKKRKEGVMISNESIAEVYAVTEGKHSDKSYDELYSEKFEELENKKSDYSFSPVLDDSQKVTILFSTLPEHMEQQIKDTVKAITRYNKPKNMLGFEEDKKFDRWYSENIYDLYDKFGYIKRIVN